MVTHRIRALIAAALVALGPAGGAQTPKVLLVGIDGIRPDMVEAAAAPNLRHLVEDGCFTDLAATGDITVSGPGWSSFLCGVWRDKHLVVDNAFKTKDYARYPHFMKRLKAARAELRTAHFVDWKEIDEHILDDFVPDERFFIDYRENGDERLTAAAAECLAQRDPDVTFVYFADVDETGHGFGFHPTVPEYLAEVADVDAQIGRLLAAMRSRPTFASEDWLIVVSSDHSGTLDGAHGRDEPDHRQTLLIVSGRAAARGRIHGTVNQVDIPATVCRHLGIPIDPNWDWDGRPIGFPVVTRFGTNLILNGDAEYARPKTSMTDNAGVPGWQDIGSMTVMRYGTPEFPAPCGRGQGFFCGGTQKRAEIEQRIDVRDVARDIDAGGVTCELSGAFGGSAMQRDLAWFELRFLDANEGRLGTLRLRTVTVDDRFTAVGGLKPDALDILLDRRAAADVPAGTRTLAVTLVAETGTGANDGYADDLSLVLQKGTPRAE